MTEHSAEAIAAAFSRHQFAAVAPALAEAVTWTIFGGEVLHGKAVVVAATDAATAALAGTETRFEAFTVHAATSGHVIVESIATYTTADQDASVVAACDVYGFGDGMLATIHSYNIELPHPYTP